MSKKELELILQEGEGYKIEFKESISGIDKDMVAFANSSAQYISLNNVSDRTARRDLKKLIEMGILKKEGTTTGARFVITSENFGQLRSTSDRGAGGNEK